MLLFPLERIEMLQLFMKVLKSEKKSCNVTIKRVRLQLNILLFGAG